MGRIRTIKPEFFKHEDLFDAEQEEGLPLRIAFAGLWTCCDREGRFEWRPRALKTDILPYDELDFSRVLDALATRGFVVKYHAGGRDYGVVPGFSRHQVVNGRETASKIPEPQQGSENKEETTRQPRVNGASVTRYEHARGEREGERERKEGGGGSAGAREADPPEVADSAVPASQAGQTEREEILEAVGADPVSGLIGPTGKRIGSMADMQELDRWKSDLGVSFTEVIIVIREVMNGKRDGPPGTFSYFTKAMQRHAGRKQQQALAPIEGASHERHHHSQTGGRGQTAAGRAHEGLIAAFAGTIPDES